MQLCEIHRNSSLPVKSRLSHRWAAIDERFPDMLSRNIFPLYFNFSAIFVNGEYISINPIPDLLFE